VVSALRRCRHDSDPAMQRAEIVTATLSYSLATAATLHKFALQTELKQLAKRCLDLKPGTEATFLPPLHILHPVLVVRRRTRVASSLWWLPNVVAVHRLDSALQVTSWVSLLKSANLRRPRRRATSRASSRSSARPSAPGSWRTRRSCCSPTPGVLVTPRRLMSCHASLERLVPVSASGWRTVELDAVMPCRSRQRDPGTPDVHMTWQWSHGVGVLTSCGPVRRGARALGRPLPAQGGDQVEQYLLDYATQLMPHRTTWPVRGVPEADSAGRMVTRRATR